MDSKYIVFDIETTGLNPAFDSILTCICAKDSEGNIFIDSLANKTETELINTFLDWLRKEMETSPVMVTCNGVDFDIPFELNLKESITLSQLGTYNLLSLNDWIKKVN